MKTTTVQIEVTQDDIEAGLSQDCFRCPIALAILRVVPGSSPRVHPVCVWIGPKVEGETRNCFDLPAAAKEFIEAFDDDLHVEPFTFDLDIPSHLIATGQEVGR